MCDECEEINSRERGEWLVVNLEEWTVAKSERASLHFKEFELHPKNN